MAHFPIAHILIRQQLDLGTVPARWVQQDGTTVKFRLGAAPFWGPFHVYHMPSLAVADQFALALRRVDEFGAASPLDPEVWAAWQGVPG